MEQINIKKEKRRVSVQNVNKSFYETHKVSLNKRTMIKYYGGEIDKTDLDEMVNGFGLDTTLRMLKIKHMEDKIKGMK